MTLISPRRVLATKTALAAALVAFGAAFAPQIAHAEDTIYSLTFQEDLFLGGDGGGYSSGLFLSRMRIASAGEKSIEPPWLLKPITGLFGMTQATLSSFTIGQTITTPQDLTVYPPDPKDAPYMGQLTARAVQVFVHDDIADMFGLSLGVVGPHSGAARAQRWVHKLTGSDRPEGWSEQVPNKLLIAVEGYRGWRFPFAAARADAIVLAGGALGNVQSSVGATALLRYGTGLERSFPTVMRVTSRTGDPFVVGRGWFAYAGGSFDRAFNQIDLDNGRVNGNKSELRKSMVVGVAGLSYGWEKSSLTFSVQTANPMVDTTDKRQSYGSLTYSVQIP